MQQIEDIRDQEQDAFDNLPESLQESERGDAMSEAIDNLESAMESVEEARDSLEAATE